MNRHNFHHFNTFVILIKLTLLLISSFLFGCSEQKQAKQALLVQNQAAVSESAVNINTASAEQLEKLPHIGGKLAQKIIEHREKFGRFRKTEFLVLVEGISDSRFREIKSLVKVE